LPILSSRGSERGTKLGDKKKKGEKERVERM